MSERGGGGGGGGEGYSDAPSPPKCQEAKGSVCEETHRRGTTVWELYVDTSLNAANWNVDQSWLRSDPAVPDRHGDDQPESGCVRHQLLTAGGIRLWLHDTNQEEINVVPNWRFSVSSQRLTD
ncbi:uncharacterized protein V6R79_006296 [Siganus canaliculatus]